MNIPKDTIKLATKFVEKNKNNIPWWYKQEIPVEGILVQFTDKSTIKAGVLGFIIDGRERTVFIGKGDEETIVGEFTVLLEKSATQVLAQFGRDIRMVEDFS